MAPETMPSIPYVSGRAWRRAHHIQLKDDGAFQETCHDEEIQAQQSPEALVGFQGLILTCGFETLNSFLRPLKNNNFKEDTGRKNRVLRRC